MIIAIVLLDYFFTPLVKWEEASWPARRWEGYSHSALAMGKKPSGESRGKLTTVWRWINSFRALGAIQYLHFHSN